MKRYADVALPVHLDRQFTYLVPPDMEQSAVVGVRAVVPFGRKYLSGLIVDLPTTSSFAHLKPLHDVLDPAPVMPLELLALCRWVAGYYFAPLGEVLKAAIPHGFSMASTRRLCPLPPLTHTAVENARKGSARRADVLAMILEKGDCSAAELQRKSGLSNINAVLNDFVRDGLIGSEERMPRASASLKTIECIDNEHLSVATIEHALGLLTTRQKKARAILETLLTVNRGNDALLPVNELLRASGGSLRTLREFAAAGVVPILRKEVPRRQEFGTELQTLTIVLNTYQKNVLGALTAAQDADKGGTFLLHGVTGSGKTQVYIEAIRHCLAAGKSAIVLVPEISLTPQMVRRFTSHFGDEVIVVHSRMSAGERQDAWRLAARGKCRIVIGPRSAIFAPLAHLGLIVVDEEHEASYKQFDSSPRYNARDVAVVRGGQTHAVVVLGSATPSAESLWNAAEGKYTLLHMPTRIDDVPLPAIVLVDMTAERKRDYAARKEALPPEERGRLRNFMQSSLSSLLREKIADRLSRGEGIILLQNRRGFAPFVECSDCGYVEMCENCNVTMTYHLAKKHLRCHYCGLVRPPHVQCPTCGGPNLALRGIGTQKVEEELHSYFPEAKVLRMDLDTTVRKGAHDRLLQAFGNGDADILLGTQMVAKGLDFARVTLVGVISADTQLLLPDFRASERTFQLLTQVAGRAGRGGESARKGEVVIQTHQPGNTTLAHVIDHNGEAFYREELLTRRELSYPPFARLALVETRGEDEEAVRKTAEGFASILKSAPPSVRMLGPAPAVISRVNRKYRWHIIVKCEKDQDPSGLAMRRVLQGALRRQEEHPRRGVQVIVDMDPAGLM